MNSLHCAVCEDPVHTDTDHVQLDAISTRFRDQSLTHEFVFHYECYYEETREWRPPA